MKWAIGRLAAITFLVGAVNVAIWSPGISILSFITDSVMEETLSLFLSAISAGVFGHGIFRFMRPKPSKDDKLRELQRLAEQQPSMNIIDTLEECQEEFEKIRSSHVFAGEQIDTCLEQISLFEGKKSALYEIFPEVEKCRQIVSDGLAVADTTLIGNFRKILQKIKIMSALGRANIQKENLREKHFRFIEETIQANNNVLTIIDEIMEKITSMDSKSVSMNELMLKSIMETLSTMSGENQVVLTFPREKSGQKLGDQ
jgi:hypothetical protein